MSSAPGPKRVLYCEVCEDGTVGGSHQVLHDLALGLDPARYAPVVVFYQENPFADTLREAGVPVHVWEAERERERRPFRGGSRPAQLAALLGAVVRRVRLLHAERIALVHLNNSPALGFDDWLPAARLVGAACVANAVGQPYAPPEERLRRRLMTGYDAFLAVSDHVAAQMRGGGFPEERLHTIPPGIDGAGFRSRAQREPAAVRRELGIEAGQVLAMMVGNMREWKGHAQVIEALRRLPPELDARLVVAFAGAVRPEDEAYVAGLKRAAKEAGLEGCVKFLGRRSDAPDLVGAADLVLHASTFPEPFGLVVVEGLALGKPVVAARRGGPVEILGEETGFLHDPDDPDELAGILARLVREPALRAAAARNARARADALDTRENARRTQEVYDAVLARARGLRGRILPRGATIGRAGAASPPD